MVDIIPSSDVFQTDNRNTKKMLLPTDAVCIKCGVIFNSVYEEQCVICTDPKENDNTEEVCSHKEFINGRESVDLRILLDFHMEDLRALCELHGCSLGNRSKIVINIMKRLYPSLDKRIDEFLVKKMMMRNKRKFRYWKDIEDAMRRVNKSGRIKLVSADECIDITQMPFKEEPVKITMTLNKEDNQIPKRDEENDVRKEEM